VTISHRGQEGAEARTVYKATRIEEAVKELEARGILAAPAAPTGRLEPVARKPGALRRFLDSRE